MAPTTVTFGYDGKLDTFIAPVTGVYTIDAFGAQGGSGVKVGGKGGELKADFYLTAGQVLDILVGQKGGDGSSDRFGIGGGGGGGGTFVATVTKNNPLVLPDLPIVLLSAGGGGGGDDNYGLGDSGGGSLGGGGSATGGTAGTGGFGGGSGSSGSIGIATDGGSNIILSRGGNSNGNYPFFPGAYNYYPRKIGYGGSGSTNIGLPGLGNYDFDTASNIVRNDGVETGNGKLTITYDDSTSTPTPTPTPTPAPAPAPNTIPGITFKNNLIATDTTIKGFGVNALSQKSTNKVSEIGIFAVDDASGKVGGIAPGAAGYLKAVTDSARSIFSTLGGTFFNPTKRELALDPNKTYEFFEVQNGSIADLQQQLASGNTPTNVLFSLPDASGNSQFKATTNSTNDGYKISINSDELVLNVTKLASTTPNIPIGAKSQGSAQGRVIDLTDYAGQTLKADFTTKSDAAYNDSIGFYAVEDAIGTIKLATGTTLKPGDANYAIEAIKSAVLQAGKTDSKTNQDLIGGKIYAPVVVAQGTFSDFTTKNASNGGDGSAVHAYFNYLGANPDKVDHFRLLGNNTFGVEDLYGGGDRDFNDVVVNLNLKTA